MTRYYVQCAGYPYYDIVAEASSADEAAAKWIDSVGLSAVGHGGLDMLVLPLEPATNLVLRHPTTQ
jgi:hypothetical protein